MNVRELIDLLQRQDQNSEIEIHIPDSIEDEVIVTIETIEEQLNGNVKLILGDII